MEGGPQPGAGQPLRSKRMPASSSAAAETWSSATTSPETGHGIAIEKGRRNLVARNVVIDARSRGISLGLDFADGTSIGGVDNIVRRNEVRGSGGRCVPGQRGGNNLLKRNVASGAKEDGFDVESRSTKLTKNRARRNADLGIDAVQGVIDGGGNRARGNGDGRQCVNVKCH